VSAVCVVAADCDGDPGLPGDRPGGSEHRAGAYREADAGCGYGDAAAASAVDGGGVDGAVERLRLRSGIALSRGLAEAPGPSAGHRPAPQAATSSYSHRWRPALSKSPGPAALPLRRPFPHRKPG